jgi:peptide/nickel transport system substrate-binding protein
MTDPTDRLALAQLTDALRRGTGRRDLMKWLTAAGAGAVMANGLLVRAGTAHAETPKKGGRIKVAAQSSSTADTLDPVRGTNTTDYARAFMFYNGLTRLDAKLVAQPELAESFSSADAKIWTFKLRTGVKFHDGSALTPADVIYSFNRVKDPKTG